MDWFLRGGGSDTFESSMATTMSDEKNSDTKQRLLVVALEILQAEGVDALTIRRIAHDGNVSVSVVHHHYVNKQGLLDACKLEFYAGMSPVVESLLGNTNGKPAAAVIEDAVRAMWSYVRANIRLARLLASEVAANGRLIDSVLDYEKRPFLRVAVAAFAPRLGLSEQAARLRIQALGVIVSRFAISADSELTSMLGVPAEQAANRTEDELVGMAKALLAST